MVIARTDSKARPAPARLSPVKSGPLNQRVYDVIREGIYCGRHKPGAALRELHLASELQVSQATVREALLRLERASLVTRTPNKGTRVTCLTAKQFRERMQLRCILEAMAAVEASKHMSAHDFAELRRLEDAFGQAWTRKEYFELAQTDSNFHHLIWQRSQNESLCQLLDFLVTPIFAFMSVVRSLNPGGLPGRPHQAIAQALQAGDEETIKKTMTDHILWSGGKTIEDYLSGLAESADSDKKPRRREASPG
jgi:DNA-binding GntR family transcriptional regulator